MRVKILIRNFSFSNSYFEFGKYKYKIEEDGKRPRGGWVSVDTTNSDNEPIHIEKLFIKKYDILNELVASFEENILPTNFPYIYLYKQNLYGIDRNNGYTDDEIKMTIKEHYFKHNEKFRKLQKELQLFESIETRSETLSREPIPEKVRFSVWRRDEGKCVQCGSNKDLEFDHIIPFSKGGSNTERNLQLLCEKCNRGKSAKI